MTDKPNIGPYADLLDLPHPVSQNHPQMPLLNRAAQFAPFAALVGFDACLAEEGRLTQPRRELDEHVYEAFDCQIQLLLEHREARPTVTVEYFEPDAMKAGGHYRKSTGVVIGVRQDTRQLVLEDGEGIRLDDVVAITGEIFSQME